MGALVLPLLSCDPVFAKNYKWSGKGQLYDERNQYQVICRLTQEKNVKPFLWHLNIRNKHAEHQENF